MKKQIILLLLVCVGFNKISGAQTYLKGDDYQSKFHIGLGLGMDYGGIGMQVEYLPVKYVGVFGGLGYNLLDPGVNAGVHIRPLPDKKIQPVLMAMYGYNAVIKLDGNRDFLEQIGMGGVSKTYYGLTIGLGAELKVGHKGNRLYLGLWLPFRSQEFHDNYDKMKASSYVDVKQDILPIGYSVGFNWVI